MKLNIDLCEPQVMAIINITPDSFFAGSRTSDCDDIRKRVEMVISQGANILDIGGYSSRPGADDVDVEQEWSRVERGFEVVRSIDPSIVVSIDTFRSEIVERAAKRFGNFIVNDISAGEMDDQMIPTVAKYQLPYIAMHMRGNPQNMQQMVEYHSVVDDVVEYFKYKIEALHAAGVEAVIIDPGFGFAKDLAQNYQLLGSLHKLVDLGYPVLAGISRKSMIYKVLDTTAESALAGTIALDWEALRQGATILRVHDVAEAVDSVKLYNTLKINE